jgi:hypothetical protein
MTTRRSLVAAASATVAITKAQAQTAPQVAVADFLFVQTAKRMSFDRATNRLTLQEVSPVTVMFSDRPERIAGNMRTAAFVPFWSQGSDSFLKDPPNADISIFDGNDLRQVVAVLQNPALEGDTLHYTIALIEGTMPESGGEVSIFIDIIGMPLTPFSFAGARRRSYRRAFLR